MRDLPSIVDCAALDLAQPHTPFTIDNDQRVRLNALVAQIAQGRALWRTGYMARAQSVADAAVARARAEGYVPLLAEALLLAGEVDTALGREGGIAELIEASQEGIRGAHDRLVINASLAVANWTAEAGRPADAERWIALARAFAARVGDEAAYAAIALNAQAAVRRRQHRGSEAALLAVVALGVASARGEVDDAEAARIELAGGLEFVGRMAAAEGSARAADHASVRVGGARPRPARHDHARDHPLGPRRSRRRRGRGRTRLRCRRCRVARDALGRSREAAGRPGHDRRGPR